MNQFFKILLLSFAICVAGKPMFAQKEITVAKDGSGNFKNIQDAINSLPANADAQRIILVKQGTYNEKIFIDKNFITLREKIQPKPSLQFLWPGMNGAAKTPTITALPPSI